jgi:predicted ATPase
MAVSLAPAPVTNLPAGLTRFVGRRHELTKAKRLLSTTRLLTLTGPGGVGKTRLALQLAAEVQRAFPDGVWLVELAELTEPALLGHTVAEALGLREQSGHWRLATLTDHLTGRHLLLILDNCEHLVDACAVLVDQLLRTCPQLHMLATSRQPLSITGEHILPVPPLPVPDSDQLPPPEALARYDAVTLFLDRATSAVPSFRLTADNHAAVARLCQALEGIPLALELAAVRLRALSASQILDRLTDRYALLSAGSRSAPSRQQTLRACIDWSFELCSPAERMLWARLAVFAGGFELDAAEGICSDDQLPREAVFDLVAALVDKSILIREERDAHIRYRLLETIRQYGQEKLREGGELATWRRRHRDWYAELVARPPGMCFGVWLGSFRRRWIRAGGAAWALSARWAGRCSSGGWCVLSAGGVSAADGRSGGPGARRSGQGRVAAGMFLRPLALPVSRRGACRVECRGAVAGHPKVLPGRPGPAARLIHVRGLPPPGMQVADRWRCAGGASPARSAGAGQLPCPDGDHCEPEAVHGDCHQHERCSDRAAPDLVVAEERARGVREPGRVLQRPDEGNPGSHGYRPGGREGGAAAGVQPARPQVSLHAGGGGGQRPEPAAGGCGHEVEVDVVAVGRRPGQVHGGGDGNADGGRKPRAPGEPAPPVLREQDIGHDCRTDEDRLLHCHSR